MERSNCHRSRVEPLSRYYAPYRKRIAEQFRAQQAAWQASVAAAAGKEAQPARQAEHVAAVNSKLNAAAADGDRFAAASAETDGQTAAGAESVVQRASAAANEQVAAATGAANTRQQTADDSMAKDAAAAVASDRQQDTAAHQQGSVRTEGHTGLSDPLLSAVAGQTAAQASAASGDAAAASQSVAASQSDPAAVSLTADTSQQQVGAQVSAHSAQLRGGGVSSIRLGERT